MGPSYGVLTRCPVFEGLEGASNFCRVKGLNEVIVPGQSGDVNNIKWSGYIRIILMESVSFNLCARVDVFRGTLLGYAARSCCQVMLAG